MEILGRDRFHEAYRVALDVDGRRVTAFVPERLLAGGRRGEGPAGRPSHQQAYEGLARRKARVERAIAALARGAAPRPPWDEILLASGKES